MKLTIIAPHFPPSALPPAQRVRMMAKNLGSLNVKATIITTLPKYREEKEDAWMLDIVGKDFDLIEVRSLNQKFTRKVGIGDLGLRMIPFLFFKLLFHIRSDKPDYLLYPVPPWPILLIAPIINFITKVPYAIDFIDPWVSGSKPLTDSSFKRKSSQWIARNLEGFVCRHASIIYAVSPGINQDIVKRNPELSKKKFYAIPYGAEESDFASIKINKNESNEILVRYIGAVSEDTYPVLDIIFRVFASISLKYKLEFYGTSYAGEGLVKPQLTRWIESLSLDGKLIEYPNRVPYKEAVTLTMESDMLLLFGGMKAYYAASKLFGLIMSKKPFVAFLHRDSTPAKFLKDMDYPFLVEYSEKEGNLPKDCLIDLEKCVTKLMSEFHNFTPIELTDKRVQNHTAFAMTKAFIQPMKEDNERL